MKEICAKKRVVGQIIECLAIKNHINANLMINFTQKWPTKTYNI